MLRHPGPFRYLLLLTFAVANCLGAIAGVRWGWSTGFASRDSRIYADLALRFESSVEHAAYYFPGRALPSAIVHWLLVALHQPLTDQSVLYAFIFFDACMMFLAGAAYFSIAARLGLRPLAELYGFLLLFASLFMTQVFWRCPIATDYAAFAMTLMALEAYLSQRNWCQYLLMLAGAFTWPTITVQSFLFLCLPRDSQPAASQRNLNRAVVGAIVGCALLLMLRMWSKGLPHVQWFGDIVRPVGVSIIIATLYLWYALDGLCASETLFVPGRYWPLLRRPTPWLALCTGVVALVLQRAIVAHSAISLPGEPLSILRMPETIVQFAVMKPAIYLVSQLCWWGPGVLICLLFWSRLGEIIRRYGVALLCNLFLGMLFSLSSEARTVCTFLPLLMPFVAVLLDELELTAAPAMIVFALILFFSKIWVSVESSPSPYLHHDLLLYLGPWMPHAIYFAHLATGLLAALILWLTLATATQTREAVMPGTVRQLA